MSSHVSTHENPMVFGLNTNVPTHPQPMVLTGMNAPHHHGPAYEQQVPRQHYPTVPQAQSDPWTRHDCTMVPVTSPDEHTKRVREGQEPPPPLPDGMAIPSSGKKQRRSSYQPPRQVDTNSVIAATGSLVGGGWEQSATSVRMRRELSGGQLDQFFRDHNQMDESDYHQHDARPRMRSMSF